MEVGARQSLVDVQRYPRRPTTETPPDVRDNADHNVRRSSCAEIRVSLCWAERNRVCAPTSRQVSCTIRELEVEDVTEVWRSTEEIAAHLGVTKDTVYVWITEKGMPAHRVGRLWKFQTGEVNEWVRSGRAAQGAGVEPSEGSWA